MEAEIPKLTAGERTLIRAAVEGDVEKVQELLSTGTNVDVRNVDTDPLDLEWSTTPLMCAAAKGQVGVMRILLRAGADVAATSVAHKIDGGGGSQALHHALRRSQVDAARLLLDAGGRSQCGSRWRLDAADLRAAADES